MMISKDIQEYQEDGRMPLNELYQAYSKLADQYGWQQETVFEQTVTLKNGETITIPIVAFYTPTTGPALWVIGGIHGEEPAGPIALAQQINAVGALAETGVPMVVVPMCNPSGYRRNWRYQNEYRNADKGLSVGDADYLLPNPVNPTQTRVAQPSSPEAGALTTFALRMIEKYPPKLVIDHHEDEDDDKPYIYTHGVLGSADPVARRIVDLLGSHGVELEMEGTTRFGETIDQGIVSNAHDGSIDDLLAASQIIVDGDLKTKPAAQSVIVIETPTILLPLATRVAAHSSIITALPELWQLTDQP